MWAADWYGEPHTLVVTSVIPPAGKFDDGVLEYDLEHPASCQQEERASFGTGGAKFLEYTCALADNERECGLPFSLKYSGTPITEPGTYRIQSWGTKTYYFEYGAYEYDGGVVVMDPEEDDSMKTIPEMTAEVRQVNTALGWREGENTFGDYIALLHSELSEALEAYRDWRLADATRTPFIDTPQWPAVPKPEGVGSEFADVLIRLLDTCDVYGIDLAAEFDRKLAYNRTRPYQHGGRTLSGDKEAVA
jgi:NTP pyrophosphatase (non-canonical NTP hydrolase)